MIGALIIHGLTPGPELFTKNPEVVYGLFVGLMVAYVAIFALGRMAMPLWVRVIDIPKGVLAAVVFGLGTIGAYTIRNLVFDVWLTVGFGIAGYFLKKFRFPMAPHVLGMVLGYLVESNYRRAMIMSQGSHSIFFEDPISLALLVLAALSFFWPLIQQWRRRAKVA